MRTAQRRRAVATVAAIAALSISASASANGRYPAAGQIALAPADPNAILVRATYGILLTKDAGKRWDWVCESAVGFSGPEDPMMSFTGDGTLVAGIFEGLSVSRDGDTPGSSGCQWAFAGGGLADQYVVDLAMDKALPAKGVLVISKSTGQNDAGQPVFLAQLWATDDDGKTWAQAGVDLPTDFLALTVDTAPSDPSRVYVSGRMGPPGYAGVLQRSDDRGATWQELPVLGSDDTHLPYIGAIDPTNPDIVYVRLDGSPTDQLVVSKDGGHTWAKVFDSTGDLLGFALSPDGATVAIGGDKDGIWTSPSSALAFTKASSVGAKCLTWSPSGLYACGDELIDGFTAGLSTDAGKTFTPIMHLSAVCGPLACGAGTSVANACAAEWPAIAATIGATSCDQPDGGGGAGGQGSSSSSSSGGDSSDASGSSSSSSGRDSSDASGCSCTVAGAGPASMASAAALLGLAAALLRRRRR